MSSNLSPGASVRGAWRQVNRWLPTEFSRLARAVRRVRETTAYGFSIAPSDAEPTSRA